MRAVPSSRGDGALPGRPRGGKSGAGSGKLVIFTESLTTQDYLRDLLLESGLVSDEEITLFRGLNESARATQALRRWQEEVGSKLSRHHQPSREVPERSISRARVMIVGSARACNGAAWSSIGSGVSAAAA